VSDLHCPARFIVLGSVGADLADSQRTERVAAVYDGAEAASPVQAEALAALARRLGLQVARTEQPVRVADVRAGARAAAVTLGEVADLYRGETVLVRGVGEPADRVEVFLDDDGFAPSR
jgi:hypothetical protein